MELNKRYEICIVSLSTLGLLAVSICAFSKRSRKKIRDRDGNKSAESGKGGVLQAAHYNHDKRNPNYNKPENGRLLTKREHYLDHFNNHGSNGLSKENNLQSLKGLFCTLSAKDKINLPNWEDL